MYEIKEITLENKKQQKLKRLVIEFEDPKMAIVGEFLMADAPLLRGEVLQTFEQVLTGENAFAKSSGNRCTLMIRPDTTTIKDLFEEMEGVDFYPKYEMETKKLRDLTAMWLHRLGKFE